MHMMGVERESFGNSSEPLAGITETGTFNPAAVDDGTWKIQSVDANKIVVKGLLKVQVTTDDPNLYLIQLSDGTNVEIRSDFGNINGNRMDLHVGSVMTLTGEIRKIGDKQIITKVVNYGLEKLPQQ
jgi:3D (Asp-Asp-Asp) domain-containing protein